MSSGPKNKLLRPLAGALSALVLGGFAGCGAIDDATKKATDAARGRIAAQCRKQAKAIDDRDAREAAIEACDAARDSDLSDLQASIRKRCIRRARQISNQVDRRDAVERCRRVVGGD